MGDAPSLAIVGPVKESGSYSFASWGEVGGSWGQVKLSGGHVEAKLAMLCHVEAICQILFGHVVALPPAGPRFWVGFCELCWLHWGVKYGYLMATVPSCTQLRQFWGCVEGYMGSFWTILLRHSQYTSETLPPGPEGETESNQKRFQNTKNGKMMTCMAIKAKRNQKPSPNPPSKCFPQWPCSFNLLHDWQNKGRRCFCESGRLEGKSATSTPRTDRAVWADFMFFVFGFCPF